jgi:hypothetical protein
MMCFFRVFFFPNFGMTFNFPKILFLIVLHFILMVERNAIDWEVLQREKMNSKKVADQS